LLKVKDTKRTYETISSNIKCSIRVYIVSFSL